MITFGLSFPPLHEKKEETAASMPKAPGTNFILFEKVIIKTYEIYKLLLVLPGALVSLWQLFLPPGHKVTKNTPGYLFYLS
jgi:hypothetical protein